MIPTNVGLRRYWSGHSNWQIARLGQQTRSTCARADPQQLPPYISAAQLPDFAVGLRFGWREPEQLSSPAVMKIAMTRTLNVLTSFDGTNGSWPQFVSLIADANGDLFGTTRQGGANNQGAPDGDGTVFEIAKTVNGYASIPTT